LSDEQYQLFQSQQIRSHWDVDREQWKIEGSELSDKIGQLKMLASSTRRMAM